MLERRQGPPSYPIAFGVFILALLVRIVAIEATGATQIAFGDALDYVTAARSVCESGVYPERGNLPFFRAPGLPFFVAGVTLCDTTRVRIMKYALAMCDAGTVVLIFLLAGSLWPAILATLHPFFIGSVTDIRTEPLFMFLLVLAIYLLLRKKPAWSGLALALAALTRPTALLCIPLFALYAWRRAHLVLLAAALTLAPWIARNVIRFGEPIVVNDAGGFNMWRGTHPELTRVVETTDPKLFAQRSWHFEAKTVSAAAALVEARAKTPAARDREWRRLALENVKADPAFAMKATLKKAALYWRPWLHPAEHGIKAIALSVIVILGLYVLGGLGMAMHSDRKFVYAVLAFFAAMWLAHLPYFPSIRLRTPLTDPLLLVFAGAPMALLTERVRKYLPLALVVAPFLVIAGAATYLGSLPAARAFITSLQARADAWWAIPLFVLTYTVCTIFLLPVGPLSAAAALMWGWQFAGTLELLTVTMAAIVPFVLAKRGLATKIERRIKREDLPALDSSFVFFLLRVIPIVPFVALNYIAGTTRIRMREYVITTFVGSIPSVYLFAYFVDTLAAGATGTATQLKIFAVCGAVAVVAVILRFAATRVARRE